MSILRADSIRDRAGTGAPDFPNGLTGNLTGTATTATTATSATTATTATNAQGLTGTPNITVGTIGCGNVTSTGDVNGVNATFSGNLTVNGTTTTIDTAVTSVDSLAVDGAVGIGTTNATGEFTVYTGGVERLRTDNNNTAHIGLRNGNSNHNNSGKARLNIVGPHPVPTSFNASNCYLQLGGTESTLDGFYPIGFGHGANAYTHVPAYIAYQTTNSSGPERGALSFATRSTSTDVAPTERLRIADTGTAIFKAGLAEKYRQGTTLAAASNDVALSLGNVHRFTTNESGAKTVNFTGVHSTLANGESVSFTVILTPNNSGYINAATVDGVAPFAGLKWSGGSAPSAGGSSGRDVYTFTIFKDGSATNSYEIFGAVTNYA